MLQRFKNNEISSYKPDNFIGKKVKMEKAGGVRGRRVLARFRNYFLTGLIVTAPVGITIALALTVINWIDGKIVPLIPQGYNPQLLFQDYVGIHIPGIGLVVVLVSLTLIGFVAAGLVGRVMVRTGERLLNRMPVIRSVYGALKQIFETVLRSSSRSFREVALIEYPRRGIWAIGFITTKTTGEVQNDIEEEVVNVFLPTTPNPTSGFLLFVPRKDIIILNMTVEEAIKMIVSAGIVTPPDRRPEDLKAVPLVSARGFVDIEENDNNGT